MIRTAILSDVHANLAALEAVRADIDAAGVERIVCLGDTVGYGPHPRECLDHAAEFSLHILGNHDSSALFDPEGFNRVAESAIFWTRGVLQRDDGDGSDAERRLRMICDMPLSVVEDDVLFVHGSPRGPTNEYVFPEDTGNTRKMTKLFSIVRRVSFQGHTHVPGVFVDDGRFIRSDDLDDGIDLNEAWRKYMVNVGSVGQPRDGDPRACYVIVDGDRLSFRRVEYDVQRTIDAVEAEPELDDVLGHRLREGR